MRVWTGVDWMEVPADDRHLRLSGDPGTAHPIKLYICHRCRERAFGIAQPPHQCAHHFSEVP